MASESSGKQFEILAYDPTPLGMLCLRRRELLGAPGTFVTEVTLNHEFLMSSYHTDSERALSSVALEMHVGEDLSVLVGGLGLGFTAHEVLTSSRVGRVDVIEFLPQVIQWQEDELTPLASELNRDSRLRVIQDDVYGRLGREPDQRYDLILIDVDHSPDEALGEESQAFYGQEGLQKASRHLNPGGVLGIWWSRSRSTTTSSTKNIPTGCSSPVDHR
jgi:spermidine synthase